MGSLSLEEEGHSFHAKLLNIPFTGLWMILGVPFFAMIEQSQAPNSPVALGSLEASYSVVASCSLFWVVWAFLFGGGYAFYRGGISLRRRDGRKATRFQCAFRALLVWAPVAGLLALSLTVARYFPDLPILDFGLWGAALFLPVVYAILAIRFPTRAPHDWLAGTYLVPD